MFKEKMNSYLLISILFLIYLMLVTKFLINNEDRKDFRNKKVTSEDHKKSCIPWYNCGYAEADIFREGK